MAERLHVREWSAAAEREDRGAGASAERMRADRRGAFAGTAVALLVAMYEGQARFPHAFTFLSVLKRSLLMMASPVAGGIAAVCLAGLGSKGRTREDVLTLLQRVAMGWVLLPCVALLYWRGSPYFEPVVVLVVLVMVLALRPLFAPLSLPDEQRRDWASLYGLPPGGSQPWRSVVIALCAQGMVACTVADRRFWAAVLLSCGLFLFAWRWMEVETPLQRRAVAALNLERVVPAGVVLTMVALLVWSGFGAHRPFGGRGAPGFGAKVVAPVMAAETRPDFVSVVLWPPRPVRSKELIAAAAHGHGTGVAKQPVVIPFDGPYWYFRWPYTEPGPYAHVVKGRKSTDVDVQSTDSLPLEMQARQNIGLPVDLSCCRAIAVALVNAEKGPVRVGVLLTDHSKQSRPFVMLGTKTVGPKEDGAPATQVVEFAIPERTAIRAFNEIVVLFDRGSQGRRRGAKIAVESFTLEPN